VRVNGFESVEIVCAHAGLRHVSVDRAAGGEALHAISDDRLCKPAKLFIFVSKGREGA
jgi:hypothetical protein